MFTSLIAFYIDEYATNQIPSERQDTTPTATTNNYVVNKIEDQNVKGDNINEENETGVFSDPEVDQYFNTQRPRNGGQTI